MKKIDRFLLTLALAFFMGAIGGPAAPLIYEGFNYGSSNLASLDGVAITGTGYSGNYGTGGASGSAGYAAAGLTFSPRFFPTSHGAALLNTPAGNTSAILGGTLSIGTPPTGTLYSSYLVNFTSKEPTLGGTAAQLRISDTQITGSNNRFLSFVDNVNDTTAGASFSGPSTNGSPAQSVMQGTTYLIVTKYSNVGTVGEPGKVTLWILDAAAFDNWYNLGGGQENTLDTYALGGPLTSIGVTTNTMHTFVTGSFTQFTLSGTHGAMAQSIFYDELRYGVSLEDVLPVKPAPSPTP
jgi:hypothetical protein